MKVNISNFVFLKVTIVLIFTSLFLNGCTKIDKLTKTESNSKNDTLDSAHNSLLISKLVLTTANNFADLKTKIDNAKSGDTIKIAGTIDVTNMPPLYLRASNVVIMGGYFNTRSPYNVDKLSSYAVIVNQGKNNKILYTTFRGNFDNQYDEVWNAYYYWCAIRNEGDSLKIIGCNFINCGKWAIHFLKSGNSEVYQSYFYGILGTGYGYGIWCGSTDSNLGEGEVYIHNCFFTKNRVNIDASGHLTDIRVDSVTFGNQTNFAQFQRHDRSTARTWGGRNIKLTNSWFYGDTDPIRVPKPADSTGIVYIANNYFYSDSCKNNIPKNSWFCDSSFNRVIFEKNTFLKPPFVKYEININKDSINVGDTVNAQILLNGSSTYKFYWAFDGVQVLKGNSINIIGKYAGKNTISCVVLDSKLKIIGIYQKSYYVKKDKPTLYFNFKTSYWQNGCPYTIQVLVDSTVIYSSNGGGKLTWKHAEYDLSKFKDGKNHTLNIVVKADSNITDIYRSEYKVWIDDVGITNSTTWGNWKKDESFENGIAYPYWGQKIVGSWSTLIPSCDSWGGFKCFQIRIPWQSKVTKGWSCTLYTGFKLL